MRVRVRKMRENGRPLPKHHVDNLPAFVGDLSVDEKRDIELGRQVILARLLDVGSGTKADVLPELRDARLLWARDNSLRLSGTECVAGSEYAQTWSVEVVPC